MDAPSLTSSLPPSVSEKKEPADTTMPAEEHHDSKEKAATAGGPVALANVEQAAAEATPDEDEDEYPKAWKLAFITIALCLSVFCMALVCATVFPQPMSAAADVDALLGQHHYFDRHPAHHGPVQGIGRCGLVRLELPAHHMRLPAHLRQDVHFLLY